MACSVVKELLTHIIGGGTEVQNYTGTFIHVACHGAFLIDMASTAGFFSFEEGLLFLP